MERVRNGKWTDGQNGQERSKGDRRSGHHGIKIYKKRPVELLTKSHQFLRISTATTISTFAIQTKLTDGGWVGVGGRGEGGRKNPQYFCYMSVV